MVNKILRILLFSVDLLRLLFIALSFAIITQIRADNMENFFPNLVYISSNAMFPLISFFILLRPLEHKNHIPLYIAGKTIAVVLFFLWAVFLNPFITVPSNTVIMEREEIIQVIKIFMAAILISLLDVLSIFGAWLLKKNGGA